MKVLACLELQELEGERGKTKQVKGDRNGYWHYRSVWGLNTNTNIKTPLLFVKRDNHHKGHGKDESWDIGE
jgi:hypothetical protein